MKTSLSIIARNIRNATRTIAEAYLHGAAVQQATNYRASRRGFVYSRYFRSGRRYFKSRP